jgi:hypothetical protein
LSGIARKHTHHPRYPRNPRSTIRSDETADFADYADESQLQHAQFISIKKNKAFRFNDLQKEVPPDMALSCPAAQREVC